MRLAELKSAALTVERLGEVRVSAAFRSKGQPCASVIPLVSEAAEPTASELQKAIASLSDRVR